MRAVIVIDMPDGVSIDEWYAVTVVVDRLLATEEELKQGIPFDESKVFKFVPLRPLPLKGTMENVDECEYNRGFVDGRNHCIELITGETE